MGVAVFAGMIGVTIFGLVLTPVFYWVVQRLVAGARSRAERGVHQRHERRRRRVDSVGRDS